MCYQFQSRKSVHTIKERVASVLFWLRALLSEEIKDAQNHPSFFPARHNRMRNLYLYAAKNEDGASHDRIKQYQQQPFQPDKFSIFCNLAE